MSRVARQKRIRRKAVILFAALALVLQGQACGRSGFEATHLDENTLSSFPSIVDPLSDTSPEIVAELVPAAQLLPSSTGNETISQPQSASPNIAQVSLPPSLVINADGSRVIRASSCEGDAVQSAIDLANNGDTVEVPAGTCVWIKTVSVGSNKWNGRNYDWKPKGVTLQGAGIGKTIILDAVPVVNTAAILLMVHLHNEHLFRLTGFTFDSHSPTPPPSYSGRINLSGLGAPGFRIDRNHFLFKSDRAIYINGWVYGVIDHNLFENSGQAVTSFYRNWGGGGFSDGSWAAPLSLGGLQAIYIEDNIKRGGAPIFDGWEGIRAVIRRNEIEDTSVQSHGTESGGRYRGIFSFEVYENTFRLKNKSVLADAFHLRGGTGVAFGNTMLGNYNNLVSLHNYRSRDFFNPWGSCDGTSLWDINDPISFETGTHEGPSVTNGRLTVNGKTWIPNQWVGYTVRNLTKSWSSMIQSSDSTGVSIHGSAFGASRSWSPGDQFEIRRAQICLDQVGRSTGLAIDGSQPTPIGWPQQESQPVYTWNNKRNSVIDDAVVASSAVIKEGRDYHRGTCRPGYQPLTYPHPLVQQIDQVPAQNINTRCSEFAPPARMEGICSANLNQCLAGTLQDSPDTSSHFIWKCLGTNGAAEALCSRPR